jgi:hypothetical protein
MPMNATATRPPRQRDRILPRKPYRPTEVTGSFGEGATQADLIAGVAVLEIARPADTGGFYWAAYLIDGARIVGVQIRKFGTGQAYFLPADLSECDCPDCASRRPCELAAALRMVLPPWRGEVTVPATGGHRPPSVFFSPEEPPDDGHAHRPRPVLSQSA